MKSIRKSIQIMVFILCIGLAFASGAMAKDEPAPPADPAGIAGEALPADLEECIPLVVGDYEVTGVVVCPSGMIPLSPSQQ